MKRKIIQQLLKWGWTDLAFMISPSLAVYYYGKSVGECLEAGMRAAIWKE